MVFISLMWWVFVVFCRRDYYSYSSTLNACPRNGVVHRDLIETLQKSQELAANNDDRWQAHVMHCCNFKLLLAKRNQNFIIQRSSFNESLLNNGNLPERWDPLARDKSMTRLCEPSPIFCRHQSTWCDFAKWSGTSWNNHQASLKPSKEHHDLKPYSNKNQKP